MGSEMCIRDRYSLTVKVREEGTNTPIIGAEIVVEGSVFTEEDQSNGLGDQIFTLYYEEFYKIKVGKWGYITKCFDQEINQNTGEITVYLEAGFYDDFTFDFGWSTNNLATAGHWERGVPNGVVIGNSAPASDVNIDCGKEAYVTGNAPDVNLSLIHISEPTRL